MLLNFKYGNRFSRKASKTILVSCNVAIALLLLAGCYGSWLNPDYFWFTSLFTIATFYFSYTPGLPHILAICEIQAEPDQYHCHRTLLGAAPACIRLRINEDFVVARKIQRFV